MTQVTPARPGGLQQVLLVSILSLGRPHNVLHQLADLPEWLSGMAESHHFSTHIVVRNNDPGVPFDDVAARLGEIEATYPELTCTLVTSVPNNGFGGGHNSAVAAVASDYILILNDDLGFPNILWLGQALAMLRDDPHLACVGATENPQHLNPLYGNGLLPGMFHLHTMTYAEASVLLFSRDAFDKLGGFLPDFAWAMCEDADLSLRAQQLGYRIAHISMPHQHWRSTSFNALPGSVKSSILEHNRAALFANWGESFRSGAIGHYEIYDVWSDGLGDVFCVLPHLAAHLAAMTPERRAAVVVNTSHPALFDVLGMRDIRVTSVRNLDTLRAEFSAEGIAALRSMRDTNFSLPFDIHALLCGSLGIAPASGVALAEFAARLRALPAPRKATQRGGETCVVHLEFDRDHDGRGLPATACAALLAQCASVFDRLILVGRERRLSAKLAGGRATVVDVQGELSLAQLAAVIAGADYFVGIDSFPAHLAGAAEVPSAVVFGAIHPLTRAWNEQKLWPICAELDCLGCYHTHLEPSVPFCMRRDQACTTALAPSRIDAVLQAMRAKVAHDWAGERARLRALQAKLIKFARHHPAPPERVFRGALPANEHVSNTMFRMIDEVGHLLRGQYQTSTVSMLDTRLKETQADLYATQTELQSARAQLAESRPREGGVASADPAAPKILQLSRIALHAVRCSVLIEDPWLRVEANDEDPQLLLPSILGVGGKVLLRLSAVAEVADTLHVYWALSGEAYSTERMRRVDIGSAIASTCLVFELAPGEMLNVRIDPTDAAGRARLRGSLGGVFRIAEEMESETLPLPPAIWGADNAVVEHNAA